MDTRVPVMQEAASGGVVACREEGAVQLHEAQPGHSAHGLDHTQQRAILFFAWPETPFPFFFRFAREGTRAKHSWSKGQVKSTKECLSGFHLPKIASSQIRKEDGE